MSMPPTSRPRTGPPPRAGLDGDQCRPPVLIEKPLALFAAQAREVLTAARDKAVFAMEAV